MSVISEIEQSFKKKHVVDVKSGDTVRVHQKIREGNKERIQVFEGLVIRVSRKNSHTASITVRRIASGIGVEKTYLIHSPLVTKIEVTKRSKVRRNYLSYMRERTGKAARLSSVDFNREEVNYIPEVEKPAEEIAEKVDSTVEKTDSGPEVEPKVDEKPEAKPEETEKPEAKETKEEPKSEKSAGQQTEQKADSKEEPAKK